ncbi:MAG: peptide-methionine (R)-S-oxide reductase MsrB [Sphingomicrobium sp.]
MSNPQFDRRGLLGAAALTAIALPLAFGSRKSAATTRFPVSFTDAEWRSRLGPARFTILRKEGTERAYSSPLNNEHRHGTFACAGCALPLYSSASKFDSGTGWPSFFQTLPNAVQHRRDGALFMERTEEHCRRCGGHLGHVFDDGPRPTGKRHCVNGLALTFRPA